MNARLNKPGVALNALVVALLMCQVQKLEGAAIVGWFGNHPGVISTGAIALASAAAYEAAKVGPRNIARGFKGYWSGDRTIGIAHAESKLRYALSALDTALDCSNDVAPEYASKAIGRALLAMYATYDDVIGSLPGYVDMAALEAQRNKIGRVIAHPEFIRLFALAGQDDPGLRKALKNVWQSAKDMINIGAAQGIYNTVNGSAVPAENMYAAGISWAASGADASEMASTAIVESGAFAFKTAGKVVQKAFGKIAPQAMNAAPNTRASQLELLGKLRQEVNGDENSWFQQAKKILYVRDFFAELSKIVPSSKVIDSSVIAPVCQPQVGCAGANGVVSCALHPEASNPLAPTPVQQSGSEWAAEFIGKNDDQTPTPMHPALAYAYALALKTKGMDPAKTAAYSVAIATTGALVLRNRGPIATTCANVWNAWVDLLDRGLTASCTTVAAVGATAYHYVAGSDTQEKDQEENDGSEDTK